MGINEKLALKLQPFSHKRWMYQPEHCSNRLSLARYIFKSMPYRETLGELYETFVTTQSNYCANIGDTLAMLDCYDGITLSRD